jgi:hypothetical protein
MRHAQSFESFLEATKSCRQYHEPSMVMDDMPSRVAIRFKLRTTGSIQMSNETKRRTRDELKIEIELQRTYIVASVFNKRITTGFPLQSSCLVKQKIELGDFAKLGEDLKKRVSVRRYASVLKMYAQNM